VEYGKGVAAHTRYILDSLRAQGHDVTVAYYQPYSMAPGLSVPSWRLGRRRPGSRIRTVDAIEAYEIGCWLPELEFTNYWPTRAWNRLIDSHEFLLSVSGNALAATPFALSGRRYLAWLGTPFTPDRQVRVRTFPIVRRIVDQTINSRICRRYERMVLNSGLILPTTSYVAREFRAIAPAARLLDPIPIPVDTSFFTPGGRVDECSLVFAGKYNDPRKNILFLLDVLRNCRDHGVGANLHLYGDTPSEAVRREIRALGLEGAVSGLRNVSREELRAIYRRSTLFVIPSFQEGLCVAALEAMACGCPVVTAPCGGPEDYVKDGVNGRIVALDRQAFTAAILQVLRSQEDRLRLSREAEATIQRHFTSTVIDPAFRSAFALLTADVSRPAPGGKVAASTGSTIRGTDWNVRKSN
jgi:glycosyltransferase involved in cell wall biosynthesis